MNTTSIVSTSLIILGAIVMALNVIKFRSVFELARQFSIEKSQNLKPFFNFHQILMLFFLGGYCVVTFAIIKNVKIIGELFIGIIFFFGAILIQSNIDLQSLVSKIVPDHEY